MAQLRQDYQQFVARGAEVLVISPDRADAVAKFWNEQRLPFPGMADPDHTVADAYGQRVSLLKMGRLPSVLIIDRDGQIAYVHHGGSMQDIPANSDVLATLDKLDAEPATGPATGAAQ
jgi:peroxiredoxin Q/BCP